MPEFPFYPRPVYSLENLVTIESLEQFPKFIEVAKALNLSMLVLEGVTIGKRAKLIEQFHSFDLIQLADVIDEDPTYNHLILTNEWAKVKQVFSSHFRDGEVLLASRLTLSESNIERVKRLLNKNRDKYEVISLRSDNEKVLKWAAHDRRVDYITIDISSYIKSIDKGLCSLMKQHNKQFEIILSPLIQASTDRELSDLIRTGKKIMELLKIHKNDFILTMGVSSPYEFRTSFQLRHISRILGLSYNSTKDASYDIQFSNLVRNHIKLSSAYIFEGVVEDNGNN